MRLPFTLAIVLLFATGCHRPLGPWRATDKWILREEDDHRPFRDQPKEVKEYSYPARDTGDPARDRGDPVRQRMRYSRYGFNAGGDIIWRKNYFNDTLIGTWDGHCDANGFQSSFSDLRSGRRAVTTSRPLGDGRFKTIENYVDSPTETYIYSFTADGGEMIREIFKDTAARHKTNEVHIYWDGNRITRLEYGGSLDVERKFFYSRWDTPDSVVSYGKQFLINMYILREYFFMNSNGDPIRHLRVAGTDTMQNEHFSYVYDRHGNWTRRIRTVSKNKTNEKSDGDPSVPGVVDREFVY